MSTKVRMVIMKPSPMPPIGTLEACLFEPWGLVAEDTRMPIVLTNHKETHDQLAALGQQSLLLQFFKVPGTESVDTEQSGDEIFKELEPRLKEMATQLDFSPNWQGRTVKVVAGGKTASGSEFDQEAIETGEVPVSVLAQFCRTISDHGGAKIQFKGTLDQRMAEEVAGIAATMREIPGFNDLIKDKTELLKAKLDKAERLAAKKQGAMPEATTAIDRIMNK
jgi:hypothetical protein